MRKSGKPRPLPLVALALSWLIPGAGHAYIGRLGRGIIIFLTIAATFWGGVAMGGVTTVDYQNERWWFVAEMLTGVHGIVGWQRQRALMRDLSLHSYVGPPQTPGSVGETDRQMRIDSQLADEGLHSLIGSGRFRYSIWCADIVLSRSFLTLFICQRSSVRRT